MSNASAAGTGASTRERIVAVASDLMTENGVVATSLKDVQAAAAVSPSQIYHYFGDKNGLVRAVLHHRKDSILDLQMTMLSAVTSIDDLRRWAATIAAEQARLGFRGGCPIGSLSYELARTDDEVAREVADAFRRWTDALTAGITALAEAGVLPVGCDVEALSVTLLALVQGGLLLGQVQQDGRAFETALATVIGLVESAGTGTAGAHAAPA